jgi:DNA-binding transcriptional LysR family regulator
MSWQSSPFDWNQARAFLATAELGSLSAAARSLRLTQPTLSRQVAALEDGLGIALFDRVGRSLSITPTGVELLDHFRAMGEAAASIALTASGQSQAVEGQVCITASDALSAYFLPPILMRLRDIAPGIEVEVLASNEMRDLRRREADIAIRHARPDQPELIAKLVRTSSAHLYAAASYLDQHGRPQTAEGLSDATFIGFAPVERLIAGLNSCGLALTRSQFKVVTDNGVVAGELIREGFGIGVMPKEFAGLLLGVEPILTDLVSLPLPFWLVTHRELLTSRRIRVVYDLLAEAFS